MISLLIHFIGFALINSAIPDYIESADSYFLTWWYVAFAAVDLIALCFAKANLRLILAMSFAWSCAMSLECFLFQDTLQRNDWLIQILLDVMLFGYFLLLCFRLKLSTRSTS